MVSVIDFKEAKHIDFNDDDYIIERLIKGAESILYSLTVKVFEDSELYDEIFVSSHIAPKTFSVIESPLAELYVLAIASELYDNAGLTVEKAEQKVRYIYCSILNSLRYGG